MKRALPILGLLLLLLLLLLVLALAACAPANTAVSHPAGTPGFWQVLWHGLISPVTFVISLFNDHVGIYAVRNDGGWYDAGFMIGVSTVSTAAARASGAAAGPRRAWRARATSAIGEPEQDGGQA